MARGVGSLASLIRYNGEGGSFSADGRSHEQGQIFMSTIHDHAMRMPFALCCFWSGLLSPQHSSLSPGRTMPYVDSIGQAAGACCFWFLQVGKKVALERENIEQALHNREP